MTRTTVSCILSIVIVLSSRTASAEDKTPITSETYEAFMQSAMTACVAGSKSIEKKAFCMCASATMTANMSVVVRTHHLRYEEQLMSYMQEITLTTSQANACIERSKQ